MSNLKYLLGPMRLPFLILTPACVSLGLGTALWTTGQVSILHAVLVFIGALTAHLSVNVFNEYFDFKSGLDFKTEPTLFSGGSGTLPEKPTAAWQALSTALIMFGLTALIGLYFLSVWGLLLLPLGLLGLLLLVAYTPWFTRIPWLCLIAPGLGCGTVMVMGTHFALTGEYSWTALIASLVPFFLVNDLLLLNQFPDVEADQSIGRKHFPITLGRRTSSFIYSAFLLLAYLAIILGVVLGYLPPLSLIGLLTLIIAVPVMVGVYRYAEDIQRLTPYLGLNVTINIVTPVLVAIGLLFGSTPR